MKYAKKTLPFAVRAAFLSLALVVAANPANAATLNAASGGTFTFNYDHAALGEYVGGSFYNAPGFILTKFSNTADSDYLTKASNYFEVNNDFTPDTSAAFVHDVTATSATNPAGQAAGRFVKSTTTNFSINSDTLAGVGTLGMTGVQAFRLPFYGTGTTNLLYGDFSLRYSATGRQTTWDDMGVSGTATGWYLQNNISFSAISYDLSNLVVEFTDVNNWKFSGDMLMGPENANFLTGVALKDVGNFCLGVGSYSGCSNPVTTSTVPVPGAVWFMGSGLLGLIGATRRRFKLAA